MRAKDMPVLDEDRLARTVPGVAAVHVGEVTSS